MSFNLTQALNSYRSYIAERMTIHFARLEAQKMLIAAQPNLAGVKLAPLEFSEEFVSNWIMEESERRKRESQVMPYYFAQGGGLESYPGGYPSDPYASDFEGDDVSEDDDVNHGTLEDTSGGIIEVAPLENGLASEVIHNNVSAVEASSPVETAENSADASTPLAHSADNVNDNAEANVSTGSANTGSVGTPEEDVANVLKPAAKPNMSFAALSQSSVASLLPDFLAQMEAANSELEAEIASGTITARHIELGESADDADIGQFIEMNLGLGVLQEREGAGGSSDSETSSDESGENIMEKLMGRKRQRDMEEVGVDQAVMKKPKIEEL